MNRITSHMIAILISATLAGTAAGWEVVEKEGELRVANDKITVELKQEANQTVDVTLLAVEAAGQWQAACRTLRPDFTKAPAANKLFDSSVTPHRYQANEFFTRFSLASRNDRQVKIKMTGQAEGRIVTEQILTRDHDAACLVPDLAMPFAEYVRNICDVVSKPMPPAVQASVPGYEDHGVFIDYELNGKPVGGMVPPLGGMGMGDALWNLEFWNNLRDADGMVYWGEKLDMPILKERGQRIINPALEAPRNEAGFFPLIYHAAGKQWVLSSLGPSPSPRSIFDRSAPVQNVPAMSKSAAYLLEFHQHCGKDPRIIEYLRPFSDGLIARIDERGAIPSYYTPDMQPLDDLHYSAQPAAMMWFLAEMAIVTGEASHRAGAERIAGYLIREIIPQQRWIDLEVYYSCGGNELIYTMDETQGLPARGNLSTMWAAKGIKALYQLIRDQAHLDAGAKAADCMSFAHASWDPHCIYPPTPSVAAPPTN